MHRPAALVNKTRCLLFSPRAKPRRHAGPGSGGRRKGIGRTRTAASVWAIDVKNIVFEHGAALNMMFAKRLLFALGMLATVLSTYAASSRAEEPTSYPVLSGIGVALQEEDGSIFIANIVTDSPADKSGKLYVGDRLISVEERGKPISLQEKTVGETGSLLRGPVGTEVTLTVARPKVDSPIHVTLKRAPLELEGVPTSTYRRFVGKPVPNLKLSSLDGTSAERVGHYRGKVVVLDFWASWCAVCFQPVTHLQALVKEHPEWAGKVEVISVTVDTDLSGAVDTISKNNWNKTRNLAVALDDLKELGVSVVPVAIVVAKDGTIASMAGPHALDFEREIADQLAK